MQTKVLLVDDDERFRQLCAEGLRKTGLFDIATASNGKQGMRIICSCQIDVAIIDLFMPEKDGLEMLRELHSIVGANLEAVDVSPLMIDPNSGQARGTNSIDLVINPTSLTGGVSAQGQVTLSQPAPIGGAVVSLFTSNAAAAVPPTTVSVPAGALSATFSMNSATSLMASLVPTRWSRP